MTTKKHWNKLSVCTVLNSNDYKKQFPEDQYDVVSAGDLTSAVNILCDPERSIEAVVIDNGFPLKEGGERVGTSRQTTTQPADDNPDLLQKEGGAGTMLLRFMRTGNTGAEAASSLADLNALETTLKQQLGDGYDARMAELKKVIAIWNSATPGQGKVERIKAIANGTEIDPNNPLFQNDKVQISENAVEWVDNNTGCAGKTFKQIFEAIIQKFNELAKEGVGESSPNSSEVKGSGLEIRAVDPKITPEK